MSIIPCFTLNEINGSNLVERSCEKYVYDMIELKEQWCYFENLFNIWPCDSLTCAFLYHKINHLFYYVTLALTHSGRVTHICVGNLTTIGSDNGLSPGRRQAIIWNYAGILSIGLLGTYFSEILNEIITIAFKKMRMKVPCAKWRPFCLGLNVLM